MTTSDMNALIRAATGRGQTADTPGTTDEAPSIDEPELTMNDLIRRASGRHDLQPDEQPSETTKPSANQVFNNMIRSDLRSRRQFSFGLPMYEPTTETS
jgi:hypothetical protein